MRQWLSRRKIMKNLSVGCMLASVKSIALAVPIALPVTDSLPDALANALQLKQPLVVMVSLQGCPFCKVIRENYLHPLREDGLQIVQIDMRDNRRIVDFDGSVSSQDAWIRKYGIKLAQRCCFWR